MNQFKLDIITPTSIQTFDSVSYLRLPGLDGLLGIQAKHANAIIALNVGEIKMNINDKITYFSTTGGFSDIRSEGVQLLLETLEEKKNIDKERAKKSLQRAKKRLNDNTMDLERANKALNRAKNRLSLFSKK